MSATEGKLNERRAELNSHEEDLAAHEEALATKLLGKDEEIENLVVQRTQELELKYKEEPQPILWIMPTSSRRPLMSLKRRDRQE